MMGKEQVELIVKLTKGLRKIKFQVAREDKSYNMLE